MVGLGPYAGEMVAPRAYFGEVVGLGPYAGEMVAPRAYFGEVVGPRPYFGDVVGPRPYFDEVWALVRFHRCGKPLHRQRRS